MDFFRLTKVFNLWWIVIHGIKQTAKPPSTLVNRMVLKEVGSMIAQQLLFKVPVTVCVSTNITEHSINPHRVKTAWPYSKYVN